MVVSKSLELKKLIIKLIFFITILFGVNLINIKNIQAADTSNKPTQLEKDNSKLATKVASDGAVLMQNKDHALPINKKDGVDLYGYGSFKTVSNGTGSGAVNPRHIVSIKEGLTKSGVKLNNTSWLKKSENNYDAWEKKNKNSDQKYSDPKISNTDFKQNKGNIGIYVLSRISGEEKDRTNTAGDFQLTKNETENIKNIANHYKHSIVVLNTGGIVDTRFISNTKNLDSVLSVSQGGENAGIAAANVLTGKTDPSGKLTDSWAYKYSDYPASKTFANNDHNTPSNPSGSVADGKQSNEKYKEGIYVGYRYFDSYNIKPRYPFGYGKSYTNFSIQKPSVSVQGNQLNVSAKIQNIGNKYSGKEVVQLYYSAPKSNLPTAMQNLGGYVKTKNLKPGESQNINIKMSITNMASFDNQISSNVLKHGNYLIRLGNNSRNTHVIGNLNLPQDVTTEKLSQQDKPKVDPTILKGNHQAYLPKSQNQDLKTAKKIFLNPRTLFMANGDHSKAGIKKPVPTYLAFGRNPKTIEKDDQKQLAVPTKTKKGATLKDVYDHKISLNSFVAGLSNKQLSWIVQGANTPEQYQTFKKKMDWGALGQWATGVPGAAGSSTEKYEKSLGIPVNDYANASAGLNLTQKFKKNGKTYYQYATGWPIYTLVAQTWDPAEIQAEGQATGKEMKHFNVSNLLAPTLNIHRDPLGGRNFEYYSEDPLVSGISAAAITRGVQSIPGETVSAKHFDAYNQETNRMFMNSVIGQQALREIYLRGFQITVQDSHPAYIMSSYNKVNNTYTSATHDLLTNILRNEWGFSGAVLTDWYNVEADERPWNSIKAGNDLLMPGASQDILEKSVSSHNKNSLPLGYLQLSAKRDLKSIMESREFASYYRIPAKNTYHPLFNKSTFTANNSSY